MTRKVWRQIGYVLLAIDAIWVGIGALLINMMARGHAWGGVLFCAVLTAMPIYMGVMIIKTLREARGK